MKFHILFRSKSQKRRALLFFSILRHRGFSCDVISSKFCKSSHLRPPCWFPHPRSGENNKLFHYFLFSSYHITKIQPSDNNISTHTRLKLQSFPWSKSNVQAILIVFLHTALYKRKPRKSVLSAYRVVYKRKPSSGENRARLPAYRVVQTLFW